MDIIRAWKDPEYRESLSELELAALPEHPAGMIELSDADLGGVAGGRDIWSWHSCPSLPLKECLSNAFGCNAELVSVESLVVLGGTDILDGDSEITQEERDGIQHAVEAWQSDPTLTAEQIERITQTADVLQDHLAPDEWEALMHSVNAIQETGSLTPEQLESLTEFAKAISEE